MARTAINVNKQSVAQLLETGKTTPFVIPEYQRPYAWTDEQVTVLFDDLWEFTATLGGSKREGTYFLGCIVSYENDDKEQEIIDGQQILTSLFLLLRAIYSHLTNSEEQNDKTEHFIKLIQPAIWRTDKLTGKVDYKSTLLTSRVVNNSGNEILRSILETGEAETKATDNYSKNYRLFQKMFEEHASKSPLMIYDFIYAVLNQAILLPITADSQDTALIIFNTLNARGLPLADADIFKAKIYNHLDSEGKKVFIEAWKSLDESATSANETIQSLFYYYMFFLRAEENDKSSTTPGVRSYFTKDNTTKDKNERLFDAHLMSNLSAILNLWKVINVHEELDEEWSKTPSILQALDILASYPNEFWKYPVIIFYLKHRDKESFEIDFERFLHRLISELLVKYCLVPTINAVKGDIMKLNVEITKSSHPIFDFKDLDDKELAQRIKSPHRSAVRMLLKILAYNKQETLLPDGWEIEHIFPQKWQTTYFPNVTEDVVKEKIEHIGNKLPFEKKLNIIAGNGYFAKKKNEYIVSNIAITKAFGEIASSDWTLDNITERDLQASSEIIDTLAKWQNEYNTNSDDSLCPKATPEELAMIENFKKRGLIK